DPAIKTHRAGGRTDEPDQARAKRPVHGLIDEQKLTIVESGLHTAALNLEIFHNGLDDEKNDEGKEEGLNDVADRGFDGRLRLQLSFGYIHPTAEGIRGSFHGASARNRHSCRGIIV